MRTRPPPATRGLEVVLAAHLVELLNADQRYGGTRRGTALAFTAVFPAKSAFPVSGRQTAYDQEKNETVEAARRMSHSEGRAGPREEGNAVRQRCMRKGCGNMMRDI